MDPRIRFGRPTLDGRGLPTDILYERFQAGDSMAALSDDHDLPVEEIEEAIRLEGWSDPPVDAAADACWGRGGLAVVSTQPTFFIDRCLSQRVAQVLRQAGASVEVHDSHFVQAEADNVWIPEVARRRWVIRTKDKKSRTRPSERQAALTAQARIITLSSRNMTGATQAALFEQPLAEIEQLAVVHPPTFVAVLRPRGLRMAFPRPAGG